MSAADHFYQMVRKYRKEHRLSQEDMAELCGICARHYQELETCKVNTSLETALRIAAALDISLDALVRERKEETAKSETADAAGEQREKIRS